MIDKFLDWYFSGRCLPWVTVFMLGFLICASTSHAATICLDRDEFAGLIQRVEQTAKELANTKAQVSLYQKANEARKEELRVSGEYVVSLEHYKGLADELLGKTEELEAQHAKELDDMTWWRNMGWGTAGAITAAVLILGVMK